ncbi:hypothetical protein SPLC1_S206700 [Arthrospira platensis C1]|nr:hypothetical protein SPLC1_S206700 [Arthrospira platensis C1]UWU46249.1 hypothetical protein APLC1_0946 [Arthrospira platensis C1]
MDSNVLPDIVKLGTDGITVFFSLAVNEEKPETDIRG